MSIETAAALIGAVAVVVGGIAWLASVKHDASVARETAKSAEAAATAASAGVTKANGSIRVLDERTKNMECRLDEFRADVVSRFEEQRDDLKAIRSRLDTAR